MSMFHQCAVNVPVRKPEPSYVCLWNAGTLPKHVVYGGDRSGEEGRTKAGKDENVQREGGMRQKTVEGVGLVGVAIPSISILGPALLGLALAILLAQVQEP